MGRWEERDRRGRWAVGRRGIGGEMGRWEERDRRGDGPLGEEG